MVYGVPVPLTLHDLLFGRNFWILLFLDFLWNFSSLLVIGHRAPACQTRPLKNFNEPEFQLVDTMTLSFINKLTAVLFVS